MPDETTGTARRMAGKASGTGLGRAAEAARALHEAAEDPASRRAATAMITVRHDDTVDGALAGVRRRIVQDKKGCANAVSDRIASRMRVISQTADGPAAALHEILRLQQDIRAWLGEHQDEAETRFAEQRMQLAGRILGGPDPLRPLAVCLAVAPGAVPSNLPAALQVADRAVTPALGTWTRAGLRHSW